jgi:hypothetical protein
MTWISKIEPFLVISGQHPQFSLPEEKTWYNPYSELNIVKAIFDVVLLVEKKSWGL